MTSTKTRPHIKPRTSIGHRGRDDRAADKSRLNLIGGE
jgi:hypothetical protein